jgi:tight adherence protein B
MSARVWLGALLVTCGATMFVSIMFGWAPALARLAKGWRAYESWANRNLRALYLPLSARAFAIRHAAAVLTGLLTGGILLESWASGILLAALFGYLPRLWLARQRRQRYRRLETQLDTTLQSLANTILTTQNLTDAFVVIAEQFDPPISQECDILVKQVHLGTPMDEALRDLALRCQSRNVDAIVTALTVGRQTGGELPAVLKTTAAVLREASRVEGMMAAKTAEGKAQGLLMSLLPFVFGGALQLIDPDWMRPLFKDPIGWAVLAVACALEFVGVMMVRKLSTIDV